MSDKMNSAKTIMKLRNGKKYEVNKKKIVSSDDESSSWIDDESCEEEEEEFGFDMKQFRGLLSELYPSNYISEKAKNTPSSNKSNNDKKDFKVSENLKALAKAYGNKNLVRKDGQSMSPSSAKQTGKSDKSSKKIKKVIESSSEEEEEEDDEEDDEFYGKNSLGKINIIFTMAGNKDDEYDDEDDEED